MSETNDPAWRHYCIIHYHSAIKNTVQWCHIWLKSHLVAMKIKKAKPWHSRVAKLHEVIPGLFKHHDDPHLHTQVNETTTGVTLQRRG